MIPQVRLSTQPVSAEYLTGDDKARSALIDYEQGGVAIGDPTQGLSGYTWELRVFGRDIQIRRLPDPSYTTVYSEDGITSAVFTFDQNMNPVVAFCVGNLWKLRWYDSQFRRYTITALRGVRDVRIVLDEKRDALRDFSDVLVFYLKDDPAYQPQNLYMLAQRDRYRVEYTVGQLPQGTTALYQAGMAKNNRLRFDLYGLYITDTAQPRRRVPPYPPSVPRVNNLILDFKKARNDLLATKQFGFLKFNFELYEPPASDLL